MALGPETTLLLKGYCVFDVFTRSPCMLQLVPVTRIEKYHCRNGQGFGLKQQDGGCFG